MLFIIEALKINTSFYKLPFKFLNSRLNLKPYNKLSKEIEDFRYL